VTNTCKQATNKESNMKKTLLVSMLVVALTFAFAATALAEHAPNNYSTWSATIAGNAVEVPTPHAGYSMTTVKCNVCHGVHRSAVAGMNIQNQVGGARIIASTAGSPEMLLRSTVSDSCSYCHIDTAIGGVRLFNGNSANRTGSAAFTGGWGHETMVCGECHAVHGAETFKGAAASKILKYTTQNFLRDSTVSPTYFPSPRSAIPNIGNNVAQHTYHDPITGEDILSALQDEIFVDPDGVTVAAGNVPQFAPGNPANGDGISNVINGVNPVHDAVGADMKDLQVGAFCTLCHGTYASGSEFVVNLDQDSTLWGGTYLTPAGPTWTLSGTNPMAGTFMSKGHPVMKATTNFQASGASAEVAGHQVAWGDANTCRKCHDAGSNDAPDGTVVYSSWPHMTPGYYRFMSAAPDAASYAARNAGTAAANYSAYGTGRTLGMTLPGTGNFLVAGAFITPASGSPLPNAAQVASMYSDQSIKGTAADPNSSVTIGRDGLCLKCHKENASAGVGMTY
jgi:hypothetical protein